MDDIGRGIAVLLYTLLIVIAVLLVSLVTVVILAATGVI